MKKGPLDNISKNDLAGFEDFLDGVDDKFFIKNSKAPKDTSPETMNYLQNDSLRLEKLNDFFLEKFPNVASPEISEDLIKKQTAANEKMKIKLFERFSSGELPLMKNLESLVDAHLGIET